jgi:hypothetical protein
MLSLKTITALVLSCLFILARMALFLFVYYSTDSWLGWYGEPFRKGDILMHQQRFKNVLEISLPPCTYVNLFICVHCSVLDVLKDMLFLQVKNKPYPVL